MGLLTDRINNKLEESNLINERALNWDAKLSTRYVKGIPFLSKMVNKRVRIWTSIKAQPQTREVGDLTSFKLAILCAYLISLKTHFLLLYCISNYYHFLLVLLFLLTTKTR